MKLQNIIGSQKQNWNKTIDSRQRTTKTIDFIDFRINIICSNQYRPKNSKLQNIIWSEKKIWTKTIDSRQRTTKTIDFIDLRINIICSNQYRPKNSKLQNIIWSQKKISIKTIDSRQQTSIIRVDTKPWIIRRRIVGKSQRKPYEIRGRAL